MDRRIKSNRINKDKHKPIYKRIFSSWLFWLLFFTVIMMICYGIIENYAEQKQPSEDWSLALEVLDNTPNDFRKIDYVNQKDKEGFTLAYVIDGGIQLQELGYLGNIQRTLNIPFDSSNIRLVTIELVDDIYSIYISDRKVLDRIDVDIETLSMLNKKRISNNSEQFDTMGSSIIVGDDNKTDIIIDGEIVATYDGYEDLKKVRIKNHEGKVYASMDTIHGGDIIVVSDDKVIKRKLTNVVDQEMYGYISDLYIKDDLLTVVSHYFNPTEPLPTLIGAWQLDSNNLEKRGFWLWNHPRTTLEPRIVSAYEKEVSYVLGIQQRLDENKERIYQYPVEQWGMFTNLSIYTRQESKLIDYIRLTSTKEYPLGYEYVKLNDGDLIIWADKSEKVSNLMLAGKGKSWIEFSRNNFEIDYLELIKSVIMMFVTTPIWGAILFILDLAAHWKIILLFSIIMLIYDKLFKEENKKNKGLLLGIIIFVIGIKFYITAISNGQLKQYINIYPNLFGNNTLLGIISIVTSILSLFIYRLWYKKNEDASRLIKSAVFIGLETYFYFFSILVYLQSAMLKIKYML